MHFKEKGKLADLYSAYCISISTTKRSDVDLTELPANTPHLPLMLQFVFSVITGCTYTVWPKK